MRRIPAGLVIAVFSGMAIATQSKDTVQVPGGLALSECKGYEDWPAVAVSYPEEPEGKLNLIVANAAMIAAYRAGIPAGGKPFPDGSRIMKILWKPKQNDVAPFAVKVPDELASIGCMMKDSKRFAETGGRGYAQFDYDPASDSFAPHTSLQGNDATCGAGCHAAAEASDFVFTAYGKR
jgi:hypothetical protein